MPGQEFTHDYEIHYYDCDARKRLSVLAMLRFFEDIALRQSEAVGVGLDFYEREQVAWLLSRWDIRIHALPAYMADVRVLTQPMHMRRFLANRRYAMYDLGERTRPAAPSSPETPAPASPDPPASMQSASHGQASSGADIPVIEADSQWVFLDTVRKRPARIPEDVYLRYGRITESDQLPTPPPPRAPERTDAERGFSVRMSDIDSNGHVNNIRYVEWALETLPVELLRKGTLRRLLVHYRREVRYGADVRSVAALGEEDGTAVGRHEIRSGDVVVCQLESFWDQQPSSLSP